MADAVAAVLSLPGLFTSCIQSFEIIQYGRTFEDDHRELVLHLEILEARLARWGHCIGILDNNSTFNTNQVEKELKLHLENIQNQFDKARKRAVNSSPNKFMDEDKDSTRATVRNAVRQWTSKYAGKCQMGMTKVQWAIHDKKILETIVCNIRNYMDDIMDVFPPDENKRLLAAQQKLQEEDVKNLGPDELKILKDLAKDYDDMIVKAVEHAIKNQNTSSHIYGGEWNIRGENKDFKHRTGDDVARGTTGTGHIYTGKYNIGGSGTSCFGNNYQ